MTGSVDKGDTARRRMNDDEFFSTRLGITRERCSLMYIQIQLLILLFEFVY